MNEFDDITLDLFGPPPKSKNDDKETDKLCPRCWRKVDRKMDGLDFCTTCNCAIRYLKSRPFSERNDP